MHLTNGMRSHWMCYRWALQRGLSVIPKSSKAERLAQNLDVGGLELSGDEMTEMESLDRNHRYNDPGVFCLGMGVFCPIYD